MSPKSEMAWVLDIFKNVYRLLCFVLWSNIWHYKKLIITYYALICPLNILRRPTRFSQKARGSFDAGYPV